MRSSRHIIISCFMICSVNALAQEVPPLQAPQASLKEAEVELNLPPAVELQVLVDYVSQRLGVKILYDEQIANKKITVVAPGKIPVSSLLGILESALKMKGFVLADAGVPGWQRIEAVAKLPQVAVPGGTIEDVQNLRGAAAVTQTFVLRHTDPAVITQAIRPYLTAQGSTTIELKDNKVLIVTDFADNIARIARLIQSIDQAKPMGVSDFIQLKHAKGEELAPQIALIINAEFPSQTATPGLALQITPDTRTNSLSLFGKKELVEKARSLVERYDVPLGYVTKSYRFKHISADRIDKMVSKLSSSESEYVSTIDEDSNLLLVRSTPDVHERIESLRAELDVEASETPSPLKFYRLKYADAEEVLETIRRIEQGGGNFGPNANQDNLRGVSPLGRGSNSTSGVNRPTDSQFVPGPNQPVQPGLAPPSTPALGQNQGNQSNSPFGFSGNQGFGGNSPFGFGGNQGLGANGINFNAIQGLARVAADASTNTIIVIGPPSVQDAYEELIEFLDRRPQQVLIEARVVILDTTDDYSLGVEVSVGDRSGERRLLEFTSFGLSDVDPVSGALSLIPGRGLNWTLVDPSQADVVLRALASHRRARVTSTPRILVNDNKTGTLASVAEVPFTSVNASQTVATTSFAGFAEAGTSIEVTPRISDEDLLQLEFTVSLNSFTGPGGDGVPPPRQTDELSSEVTIPDGHTVIIGGLNRSNTSGSQDGIPFIENIPILKELTSITTKNSSNATLFFFLRPIILRDDKFEDLKFISESDAAKAGIQGAFPASSPILVQ